MNDMLAGAGTSADEAETASALESSAVSGRFCYFVVLFFLWQYFVLILCTSVKNANGMEITTY